MAEDLIDTVCETVKLLRKAVLNCGTWRPMSQMSARHLRHMADQCGAEANELARHYGID